MSARRSPLTFGGYIKGKNDMTERKLFIPGGAIDPALAPGRGSCYATDAITVEGEKVGFMYREQPDDPIDSGWRFFAGTESQQYLDDPKNLAIYDVNTIANYDPEIILLLDAAIGSAFERRSDVGLIKTRFPSDPNG
jgi:hypothetical protein